VKRIFFSLLALAIVGAVSWTLLRTLSTGTPPLAQLKQRYAVKSKSSVDHSQFAQLQRRFARPQEVTAACISCHNGRAVEVMRSSHWNWERTEYVEGKGIRSIGKKNILNNFCIGITSNERSCNRCHIGYGYANDSFDFSNPLNVDCLACHDNSGRYVKAIGGAGMPDRSVDLTDVAQHVGKPQRANCGTCHFFGGGGNNVKHGDLEQSLFDAPRTVDVHMGTDGIDMTCTDCHTAREHQMLGKVYSVSSMNRDRVNCAHCHSEVPHEDAVLNSHTLKVACQTCHIPVYAKVNPTKLSWDWSTAGQLKNGRPFEVADSTGVDTYMSIKGTFEWGSNLKPDYIWFNGTASHNMIGDTIDPSQAVKMNDLRGRYDDPESKIVPVKVHRATQIYDVKNRYLIQPKTYSSAPGDSGFWAEFNWHRAAQAGMSEIGLPYSGEYGFVKTEMTWPINHMVSPASAAVACNECHTPENGRLANLTGFYLPGRDSNPFVETLGTLIVLLTLAGVSVHGGARIVIASRRKERNQHAQ